MNAIVETGHCIRGVVVFNGSLYSRVYGKLKYPVFLLANAHFAQEEPLQL